LNCAARNASDPLLIKTLLNFGADVDACGVDGRTALIHAARINKADFALLLIQGGANINHTSSAGHTPLTTAVVFNSHDVLKLLLGRGKDYETCPRLKWPHLIELTAQYADLEAIMILNSTDHFKLKFDSKYISMNDYEPILAKRHNMSDGLKGLFANFFSLLRSEKSVKCGRTDGNR
jgi:ankyrin repeat protein